MALGTDHMTTTTGAVFIPEIWSREIIREAESQLVAANLVKRYDADVSKKGDTIHVPEISNLTTNSKSASTAVTLQTVTEGEQTISIDTHEEVSFLVEDIVKTQSQYDLMHEYTEKAGYAIAQKVDSDVLALYSSLTSTDVGTYGSDITDAVILSAIQTLDEVDVPMENRAIIIAPSQKTAIAKIDKFVRADYLGEAQKKMPSQTGPASQRLWGDIYGIPVYWTNQVPTTAGTPTQVHNLVFHKEAFALAMQQKPRTQAEYKLEYLGWLTVSDILYGVAAMRTTWGVEMRS